MICALTSKRAVLRHKHLQVLDQEERGHDEECHEQAQGHGSLLRRYDGPCRRIETPSCLFDPAAWCPSRGHSAGASIRLLFPDGLDACVQAEGRPGDPCAWGRLGPSSREICTDTASYGTSDRNLPSHIADAAGMAAGTPLVTHPSRRFAEGDSTAEQGLVKEDPE